MIKIYLEPEEMARMEKVAECFCDLLLVRLLRKSHPLCKKATHQRHHAAIIG